jgi:choline kinase
MKAIILAAGEGKRLRPLTDHKPKALVKIWGETLLIRQMKQLTQLGIDDITVVTGYQAEKIDQLGVATIVNNEYNTTNMVCSLSKALPELSACNAKNTLILYGDIAYKSEHLSTLINCDGKKSISILGNTDWYKLWSQRLEEPLSDAETFQFDEDRNLLEIGEKPISITQIQAQYMGMIKVDTQVLVHLLRQYVSTATSHHIKNMYMTDFIQAAILSHGVYVELVSGGWIEVDSVEDYELYTSKDAGYFGLT